MKRYPTTLVDSALWDRFMDEISRILKPGGSLVIVESSQPRSDLTRFLFHLYLRLIVSGLGKILSKHGGAYEYLAYSARHFYAPDELMKLLEGSGFRRITYKPLFGGVAGITVCRKS